MTNPWLQIPASDYEGHMGLPSVGQLSFLGRIFKESLARYDGRAVAVLGCATGNGLEHIDAGVTRKLTVIDINPEYLEILRSRHQGRIPHLEIIEADLSTCEDAGPRYSLIFAGLIFEYLAPAPLLGKIAGWLEDGGTMTAVLQLPDPGVKKVSDTPYPSLKRLGPIMNLVSRPEFRSMAEAQGLREIAGEIVVLESGKPFYVGAYEKTA